MFFKSSKTIIAPAVETLKSVRAKAKKKESKLKIPLAKKPIPMSLRGGIPPQTGAK